MVSPNAGGILLYSDEFARIGKRLLAEHLVGGSFGNISMRGDQGGFFIKRTGTYIDVPGDPVYVPLNGIVPEGTSSEYRVHREVYKRTPHQAIVHAHPPVAVALSLIRDLIVPEDSEGMMFCPEIPVVTGAPGSQEIADNVAAVLAERKLVVVRGHGTFAAGKTLDEAYLFTSLCEHACRVLAIRQAISCRNSE